MTAALAAGCKDARLPTEPLTPTVTPATPSVTVSTATTTRTAPPTSTPTMTPPPSPTPPPAMDLAGRWTGTVRDRGRTDEFFCPGWSADVSFSIAQSGASLQFSLPPVPGCSAQGALIFSGSLAGDHLTGTWSKQTSPCLLSGSASGSVGATHIELDGRLAGDCNDVLVHLEVSRQ